VFYETKDQHNNKSLFNEVLQELIYYMKKSVATKTNVIFTRSTHYTTTSSFSCSSSCQSIFAHSMIVFFNTMAQVTRYIRKDLEIVMIEQLVVKTECHTGMIGI